MKKKIMVFVMATLMLFASSTTALATDYDKQDSSSDLGNWEVRSNADGDIYLKNTQTGEKMIDAYGYDDSGCLQKVDLTEYAQELNQTCFVQEEDAFINQRELLSSQITDGNISSNSATWPAKSYSYKESRSYKGIGSAQKCTPDVVGPGTLSHGQSFSISNSFGADLSLSSAAKNAIKAGVSFSWSITLDTASNFGMGYQVPWGKTGYVQFRPYYNVSKGTLSITYLYGGQITGVERYSAWGQCPMKTATGFADGKYELITY